jgi:NAD(P)-dependent dehydrogenase (short-subunit alcohol dehydrogenase family)
MRKITHQARPGERHDRGGRHALARLPAPAGVKCTRRSACGPGWLVRLVGRLGKPEEIARVAGFPAAGDSACITGQIGAVNGGLDM